MQSLGLLDVSPLRCLQNPLSLLLFQSTLLPLVRMLSEPLPKQSREDSGFHSPRPEFTAALLTWGGVF